MSLNVNAPVAVSLRQHARAVEGDRGRVSAASMPTTGALVDRYGRVHDDLRVSVTDRCNLRCVYCMPDVGMTFLPHDSLLSFDEIVRVATVAASLGVSSLRLTGGEPLVRKGLVSLVSRLSMLGFDDLSLTTNGMLLTPLASNLASAGLSRVNISCDSLRAQRFESIRRRGDLATVLSSMDAAEAAGLLPLKVNVVILRGVNDDEILDFAAFARDTGRIVRFIEFMPLDAQGHWDKSQIVAGREIFEQVSAVWPLEATKARRVRARRTVSLLRRSRRDWPHLFGHSALLWLVQSVATDLRRRTSQLSLLRRRTVGARSDPRRRGRPRDRRDAATRGVGEVPRTRDQRAGLSSTGALDVDDRRVAMALTRIAHVRVVPS